jgi:hypothetical protein
METDLDYYLQCDSFDNVLVPKRITTFFCQKSHKLSNIFPTENEVLCTIKETLNSTYEHTVTCRYQKLFSHTFFQDTTQISVKLWFNKFMLLDAMDVRVTEIAAINTPTETEVAVARLMEQ